MYCKNCGHELVPGSAVCLNCGIPVQNTGATFCQNCGAQVMPGAVVCTNCGVGLNMNNAIPHANQKSKLAAGILGIMLGSLGVHNFYLGYTGKAVAQLLLTLIGTWLTCGISAIAASIWGIVEGIQILTGSINTDAVGIPLSE